MATFDPTAHMMTDAEYVRFHQRRFRMMVDLLARHLRKPMGEALDVGGGGDLLNLGTHLRDTYRTSVSVVALGDDVAASCAKGLQCFSCDVDREPLPFGDNRFELVTCASVFEHLYNPRFALREMTRVLKPGGLLMLEMPNAVALGRRVDVLKGRNPFRFFNFYNAQQKKAHLLTCSVFYAPEEIVSLLSDEFEIVERVYGLHTPRLSFVKTAIHEALVRLFPRMSDCFAVLARRRPAVAQD